MSTAKTANWAIDADALGRLLPSVALPSCAGHFNVRPHMEQRVTLPTTEDIERLEAQRTWVRDHYSPEAKHKYETLAGKLTLLQTILDAGWIDRSDTVKLQCLGITLGDAVAQELEMQWVMVEDEYGRDPAIRAPGTTIISFPLTMISKRIERGETVDVRHLYDGVCDYVRRMRTDPELQRH